MIEAINGLIEFKILSSLWGDKMWNKCPIFMAFLFQFNFGKKKLIPGNSKRTGLY